MPYRVDRSPKPPPKVPPMYSPRIDGGGVFATRAVPPSPLSKGLEGPRTSGSSSTVDYDDVFGGPPKFSTSMFSAQAGPATSASLDRSTARAPSFRSTSLPVFELPVFGDDVFGSSNTFEPRAVSVAYDDIFREEVHTPDVFPASGMYGNVPRSKPSSRSSSRRMSPVHPAAALPAQLAQEEILAAANSGGLFKFRSSFGKLPSRNSFSSASFDEGRSKPLDSSLIVSRKDTVGSSLPSSPPHAGTWSRGKRFIGSDSANSLNASSVGDVDDVFGGFPQRTYSLAFQAAHHGSASPSRTHSAPKKEAAGNKPQRSPFTSQSSESLKGSSRPLSNSFSSDEEQELQDEFIEIRMDIQNEAATSEIVEAAGGRVWVSAGELNPLTRTTPKWSSTRPPPSPTPASQLKHKSWKDWTSDLSLDQSVNSSSSGLARDSLAVIGTTAAMKKNLGNGSTFSQFNKGLVETGSMKQFENISAAHPLKGKYTLSSPLRTAVKAKPLEDKIALEDMELQAILTNAWKINEKRERKKTAVAKPPQAFSTVLDSKMQELSLKEGKRQSNKMSKTNPPQQVSRDSKDRDADSEGKTWKNYSSKEKKDSTMESSKSAFVNDNTLMRPSSFNIQDLVEERFENSAKPNSLSETEDSFDPEEIVKVVTEEMSTSGLKEVPHTWAGGGLSVKSGQGGLEDVEFSQNLEPVKASEEENGSASALSSAIGSDFVQYSDQQEVIVGEDLEDIDSLIGPEGFTEGFQDIDGESAERRRARLVRHLRAKQRVAKALEEMQARDAEVQRQQEEKQHLAETADRQIKRWAVGKEGNLRALLSNLQHVLWPESGWQPISLKDLIEGPDVKKAYRKATLFVHPDKVQQKGATLQQKYIAERVFDILQEAWKTFNLQELF